MNELLSLAVAAIFGSGGGEQMAAELSVPLLGQVPIDPNVCEGGDSGMPLPLVDETATLSLVFSAIAAGLNQTFSHSTPEHECGNQTDLSVTDSSMAKAQTQPL